MNRKFEDDEIKFDLLWAISYISDSGHEGRQLIITNKLHFHSFKQIERMRNSD